MPSRVKRADPIEHYAPARQVQMQPGGYNKPKPDPEPRQGDYQVHQDRHDELSEFIKPVLEEKTVECPQADKVTPLTRPRCRGCGDLAPCGKLRCDCVDADVM